MKYGNGEICYRRTELPTVQGNVMEVRVTASRVDSQEMRAAILSLWAMLPWDQRLDMMTELEHYANPGPDTFLPDVALAACQAQHGYKDADLCPQRPDQELHAITRATP